MKIKKILISLLLLPIALITMTKNVFAWDLQPISDNQINYGFQISPTGTNTDYLLDINIYTTTAKDNIRFNFDYFPYLDSALYYDFDYYMNEDADYVYNDNGIEYTTPKSSYILGNTTREFDITDTANYSTISNSNLYITHLYGKLSGTSSQYRNITMNTTKNSFHCYIYIGQSHLKRIEQYYINNYGQYNLNDYMTQFVKSFGFTVPYYIRNLLTTENYIFNYDTPYSAYVGNTIVYTKDFLYNNPKLNYLYKYGYGFFQTTYSVKQLNISGSIFDRDTNAIYPTYSGNMLYYVLPPDFPSNKKFSDNIDYSTIESLSSFDSDTYVNNTVLNQYTSGLYKSYNPLAYSDYLKGNFYAFGFSRCLDYSYVNSSTNKYNLYNDLDVDTLFKKNNAFAYYNYDIDNNSSIDTDTNNDDLANAIGLHYVACKWWDLKGQLQNLFYYIITGLPFLNEVYKISSNFVGITKLGFSFFGFSTLLTGLFGFILLVKIIFDKMLK